MCTTVPVCLRVLTFGCSFTQCMKHLLCASKMLTDEARILTQLTVLWGKETIDTQTNKKTDEIIDSDYRQDEIN